MTLMTTLLELDPDYVWIVFDIHDGEVLAVFDTEQKATDFQDSQNVQVEQAYYEKHKLQ